MRLLTLSQVLIDCVQWCLSYNKKDNIAWEECYLALRTHMGTLGLIYHIHHWTWNWQSGQTWWELWWFPSRVLHCGPPPLESIPSHSLCLQGAARHFKIASGMRIHAVVRKIWSYFLLPKYTGNWLESQRDANLSTYIWKTVHLPSEMVSFPQNNAWPKLNSDKYHAVFCGAAYTLQELSLTDGKHKKYINSQSLLTWAWKLLSAVIELK